MPDSLQFFMAMEPPTATHQQKQVRMVKGKPVFYEPPNVQAARQKLAGHLYQHKPAEPFDGPLCVMVKWLFPVTDGHANGQYKHTRPDAHNLNKLLFDVMTDLGYWHDDAQVASEIIEKFWSDTPGIFIQIRVL